MNWAITDRVTRIDFYGILVLATIGFVPLVMGANSLILIAAVLILLARAWRLAMARHVRVVIDQTGITKTIGTRTWHLPWVEARAAALVRFLGTDQLIVTTGSKTSWNASDKLYLRLGAEQVAVQVPTPALAELRELLRLHGLPTT